MVEHRNRATVRRLSMALPRWLGVPVRFDTRIVDIKGRQRVEAVTLCRPDCTLEDVECDGVLFTGRFTPGSKPCTRGRSGDRWRNGRAVDRPICANERASDFCRRKCSASGRDGRMVVAGGTTRRRICRCRSCWTAAITCAGHQAGGGSGSTLRRAATPCPQKRRVRVSAVARLRRCIGSAYCVVQRSAGPNSGIDVRTGAANPGTRRAALPGRRRHHLEFQRRSISGVPVWCGMRVAAIDQGTTSTRVLLADTDGAMEVVCALTHRQDHPKAGWVEHDPEELLANIRRCIESRGCGRRDRARQSGRELSRLGCADGRGAVSRHRLAG